MYLFDENEKNSYFSHKSELQWPVMNKWKPLIYFQTKSDFLDTFLLSGLLWYGQHYLLKLKSCKSWKVVKVEMLMPR